MTKDIRVSIEIAGQKYGARYPCPQDQAEIDVLMEDIEKAIRETLESELL